MYFCLIWSQNLSYFKDNKKGLYLNSTKQGKKKHFINLIWVEALSKKQKPKPKYVNIFETSLLLDLNTKGYVLKNEICKIFYAALQTEIDSQY